MIVICFFLKFGCLKEKVKFDNIPKTNQEYITVTYVCIRVVDRYRFLSSRQDSVVKTLDNIYFEILKKGFPGIWENIDKNVAYPYEYFNSIHDSQKPVNKFKNEDFFGKIKNVCPSDEGTGRTKGIIRIFFIKNEELTNFYIKNDVILSSDFF